MNINRERLRKIIRIFLIIFIIGLICQLIIPIFYTNTKPISPNGNTFKVLTYNVQSSTPYYIQSQLEQINADVIGLQEINSFYSQNLTQSLNELASELGLFLIHFSDYDINKYNLAILSRFPQISSQFIDYTFINYAKPRGLQQVILDTPWGELQVFNTHLNTPNFYTTRVKQVNTIFDEFTTSQNTILLGDLNTPNYFIDYTYNKLSAEFEDAWVIAGNFHAFGNTYHSQFPWVRIDYVFVSPDIGIVENSAHLIENSDISDHKGVQVDVALEY